MATSAPSLCFLMITLVFSGQVHAFGAGNIASISRIEGQNWRHGDIEDVLLTLFLARVAGGRKFSKLDVQRVYFGNWLRDYSQAVDIGTLKYVSAEAIRILIWILGFLSFGYGTREFEVTTDRLGCYEPTEHIDNPLGYGEGEDARNYDPRLRGPVDQERELSIDSRTGLKNYIATEDIDIATSAGLVRRVFSRSILLGRQYAMSQNEEDLHEALRLLGTGLHCLEDFAAHSNYIELSLIEMGETDVFPHVGRSVEVKLADVQDHVYPVVTGTFGGVDFFHSVLGELSDKVTQSEIQSLEGVIAESQSGAPNESFMQGLLSKIPDGLIGDSDGQASKMGEFKAQSENAKDQNQIVSPREPEEWARYLSEVHQRICPVLEWHDEIIKSINCAIENIPVLPELVEQIQEQITVFVFSVLAPYVLPIISQVKTELQTSSSELIQSSQEQQHIVFDDDESSDPTHSMLSKDHFSNVLNEPAGRVASRIVTWTVPQLMECWDNEDIDISRTLDRIISGVFHHPALREHEEDGGADARRIMFSSVEEWWHENTEEEKEHLREQLSRQGVLDGRNHKEGIHDTGHGCGKSFAIYKGNPDSPDETSGSSPTIGLVEGTTGGGTFGSLVSGLVSGVGSVLLQNPEPQSSENAPNGDSYGTQTNIEYDGQQSYYQSQHDEIARHEATYPPEDEDGEKERIWSGNCPDYKDHGGNTGPIELEPQEIYGHSCGADQGNLHYDHTDCAGFEPRDDHDTYLTSGGNKDESEPRDYGSCFQNAPEGMQGVW
ncbi:heterokaryon incompatibility protein Het-C-domain-containing protein [Aspergillus avenaceus]|uniref:Heterokaryon incompatibility protein Het-C-domain-containing protein n=1 Tax=Aspergillus avenaceus TaxID=36643 RepID=A0A5N6TGB1_ASPAV|nr:heterokaryon incompatibility protein Het-C-domain-containing protein [Aspergillus avenaceus]